MGSVLLIIVVLAGCAPFPPKTVCPQCPPPKPVPETVRYRDASFDALPGWPAAALEPSLRAFLAGCPRPGALARACELARAVPANDELAARQFFESSFIPYALISSESGDGGVITGYYEPVIDGSRTRRPPNRYPTFAVPDHLTVLASAPANPT